MRKKNIINFAILFSVFFIANVSAISVHTDKETYYIWETVFINGSEFSPGQTVGIEIKNPNNLLIFINETTPDQDGNFTTSYLIPESDPIYIIEGTYTVYASSKLESAQKIFNMTILDTNPPTFSGNQTNETEAGKPCKFMLTWDDIRLHPYGQYIFSTNNSGRWVNATTINFTSTPQTVSNVTILNNTETLILWKYYASDNSKNWTVSDNYEVHVVTTVPCELHSVNITPECSSSGCEPGERIIVNATYSGDCPSDSYIQVNANGTDCYICDQDRDICEEDLCNMTGISVVCLDSPCSVGWTIPDVPSECQGKTVNATYSSLNSNYPCRSGNEKKDEVIPTGSFTFYTATAPTTTSPGVNGNGNGGVTTSTTTTTVYTTTYYITTTEVWTTSPSSMLTTTLPIEEKKGFPTYWIILIVVIGAVAGFFVWFKFFRGTGEESEFDRLKEKWSR